MEFYPKTSTVCHLANLTLGEYLPQSAPNITYKERKHPGAHARDGTGDLSSAAELRRLALSSIR